MTIFDVLNMIGGLALFLFGMHVLGEGLTKISGGKLERILERLTNTPLKAVALGAAVTAVIQSSSATTVMVVGFVNSGIMKLTQAVGIIMGANIGTTMTSWILSLSSIEGDSFFVQMLKPSSFSPILAIIGVAFLLFSKKEKLRDAGTIMVGFAVLMFGMDTMSAAVSPLQDVPEFANMLLMFSNPILGMLAGAVLTAIIQSSSASVGILQALCSTGVVTVGTAIPIIMGQNIGTCITAILSAIGANKNAKRAALIHLYFNLIGTIIFMIVFYTLNVFLHFEFLTDLINPTGIAIVHSSFNIFATIILLPFSNILVKLAYKTIKVDESEKVENTSKSISDFLTLDERFLDTPGFAIDQCKIVTNHMAYKAKKNMVNAMNLILNYDENAASKVEHNESRVNSYEDKIGTYLIKLSGNALSEEQNHTWTLMLHTLNDIERISDHATAIMKIATEIHAEGLKFSEAAKKELEVYMRAINDILTITMEAYEKEDLKLAVKVEPLVEIIKGLQDELKTRHVERLKTGECTIEMGIHLTEITTLMERAADHCSNMAVCMLQINNNTFETHEYLNNLRSGNDDYFEKRLMKNRERYMLPEVK